MRGSLVLTAPLLDRAENCEREIGFIQAMDAEKLVKMTQAQAMGSVDYQQRDGSRRPWRPSTNELILNW